MHTYAYWFLCMHIYICCIFLPFATNLQKSHDFISAECNKNAFRWKWQAKARAISNIYTYIHICMKIGPYAFAYVNIIPHLWIMCFTWKILRCAMRTLTFFLFAYFNWFLFILYFISLSAAVLNDFMNKLNWEIGQILLDELSLSNIKYVVFKYVLTLER